MEGILLELEGFARKGPSRKYMYRPRSFVENRMAVVLSKSEDVQASSLFDVKGYYVPSDADENIAITRTNEEL